MFGVDKNKINEASKDPQKVMDYADQKLNKGLTGFMNRAFMGKDFVNDVNASMQRGREAMEKAQQYQNQGQFAGLPAKAEVISIQDTGQMVNYNPIVILQLKVTPEGQFEAPFETTAQAMVSKIAVPRVGDVINIKYSPSDHTQIVIA